MSSAITADELSSAKTAIPDTTRLAVDRTRLALERTMTAWVRTATSLITFGFTVYKFFELDTEGAFVADRLIGPREFGLMMISFGIIGLLLATLQHRQSMKALRVHYRGMRVPYSIAAVLGGFIAILGVLALLAVIFRQ